MFQKQILKKSYWPKHNTLQQTKKLLRFFSEKKNIYILTNIKKFCHTKLFFSDEVKSKEAIMVVSNDNIESKETEVAKTFYVFSQILLKIFKFRDKVWGWPPQLIIQ